MIELKYYCTYLYDLCYTKSVWAFRTNERSWATGRSLTESRYSLFKLIFVWIHFMTFFYCDIGIQIIFSLIKAVQFKNLGNKCKVWWQRKSLIKLCCLKKKKEAKNEVNPKVVSLILVIKVVHLHCSPEVGCKKNHVPSTYNLRLFNFLES